MINKRILKLSSMILLIIYLGLYSSTYALNGRNLIVYTDISGYISIATVEHVRSTLTYAESVGAKAVVLQLNTLGGTADAMMDIVQAILASKIPVIGYVYPQAAQSLSAGTYILVATDYAVMAPYSIIGSAQPVVGSEPTKESKYINAFKQQMISYAALHGRNTTVAEKFVTENLNLYAQEAKECNIIDAVEPSLEELLKNADGKSVKRGDTVFQLQTYPFELKYFDKPINVEILIYLTDPLLSSLLLSIGILVLLVGLSTPGMGAEIVGAMMVILGLVGFGININIVSAILVIFGAVLFVIELKKGAHGIAALIGTFAIALGFALTISNPFSPTLIQAEWVFRTLLTVVIATLSAGFILTIIIVKAISIVLRRKPIDWLPTGEGRAVDDILPGKKGYVVVGGEYWQAISDEEIRSGDTVIVVGREGGVLKVRKKIQ
ncbi:MAG: nodulation protein NfeD [Nitrososphaeria archaeon]